MGLLYLQVPEGAGDFVRLFVVHVGCFGALVGCTMLEGYAFSEDQGKPSLLSSMVALTPVRRHLATLTSQGA